MKRPLEIVADPNEPTILTRRWFAAPPELVWQAWTRAELARRWMGPRHLTCVSYEIDLRVGGGWRFVHRAPDGQEFGFHGEYREIEPHRRLVGTMVFEMMPDHPALDTLTLEAKDGGTLATTFTRHGSMEARDGHLHSGMEEGMSDGYDRLDSILANELRPGVTPFLWYASGAEDAAAHYLAVFQEGREVSRQQKGDGVLLVEVELRGQRLVLLNGNPGPGFTQAASLAVMCDTQEEIDHLWAGLCEGEGRCGWLEDRWGVTWQIVPRDIGSILGHPDPAKAQRAFQAMFTMGKLDIAALRAATEG